jgi:hypothetical protein
VNHTQFVHEPRKLPVVLSPEEVAVFSMRHRGLKYKAALSVAYGAGLRVSEVVALKVSDIDSERMVIRIEQGIRRFLIHVLPHGFHRIRHYGLLASGTRADNIARARRLLDVPVAQPEAGDNTCAETNEPKPIPHPCPCCGGRMIIIETFQRGSSPRYRPAASTAVIRIDTS